MAHLKPPTHGGTPSVSLTLTVGWVCIWHTHPMVSPAGNVSDEVLPPQNPVSLTSLVSAYEASSGASAYTCSVIAEPCRWKDP